MSAVGSTNLWKVAEVYRMSGTHNDQGTPERGKGEEQISAVNKGQEEGERCGRARAKRRLWWSRGKNSEKRDRPDGDGRGLGASGLRLNHVVLLPSTMTNCH